MASNPSHALMDGLTELQCNLVSEYLVSGANVAKCWKRAGYKHFQAAYNALKLPHVKAALQAERERIIQTEIGTLGLSGLRKLLTDPETPSHVLLGASKYALALAGHCEPASSTQDDSKSKPLSEMSLDELKDYVAKGKVILDAIPAAMARPVDISPPEQAVSVSNPH